MTRCSNCGKPIEGLPFKCPYCGKYFCSDCRMPEVHLCDEFKSISEMKKNFFRYSVVDAANTAKANYKKDRQIGQQKNYGYRKNSTNIKPKRLKKKVAVVILFILLGVTFYFLAIPHLPDLSDFSLPFFKKSNDAPLNFSVTTASNSSIILEWQKRWHADNPQNNYVVYTLIKRREGTYPESISDHRGITVYNGTGNYTVDTNLQPGKIYCYRAWHLKKEGDKISYSNNYAQAFNLTKPLAPQSLIAQSINENQIRLIWEKGKGSQYTYIVRKEGSIPKNMHDGYVVGNLTGNSLIDSSLEAGKIYYYNAWHYVTLQNITQWSSVGTSAGNLTIPNAPTSLTSEAIDTSTIDLSWTKRGGEHITIIVRKKNSPPENIDDGIQVYRGIGTHFQDKYLEAGQLYCYKAWHMLKLGNFSQISNSFVISNALTKPYAPSALSAVPYDNNQIKLRWKRGYGSDTTYIVRKTGSMPDSPKDGVVIYQGSNEIYYDRNLTKGTQYYYRAWSHVCQGQYTQFSENFVSTSAFPIAPTYSQIVDFVERDTTDEHEYGNGYVCHNFSVDVIKNADKEDIHGGYVRLDIPPLGHAIVAFNTSDKGLIFLEPQMDYLFTEQEMQNMVENERYYIEITWWEGNIKYIEKFDYPLYGYEIYWNYL